MKTSVTTKGGIARFVGKLGFCCLLLCIGYYAGHKNAISSRATLTDHSDTFMSDEGANRGFGRAPAARRSAESSQALREGKTEIVRVHHYTTAEIAGMAPKFRSVEQLLLMAEGCKLAEFNQAWNLIEETGLGAADRIKVLARLCSYVTADGGLEVVLARIKAMPESGERKNELILASFFGSNCGAEELLGRLGEFEFEDERKAALGGIAGKIRMIPLDKLDLARYPKVDDLETQEVLGKALGERLSNVARGEKPREFTDLLGQIRSYVASGKVSEVLMGAFFKASADVAPVEAWDQWRLMGYGATVTDSKAFEKVSERLALGLLHQGGEYAMQQVVVPELAATPANAKLSGLVFYGWLRKDLNGATTWLSNQEGELSGVQGDAVYQASIQFNLENSQWEAARGWLPNIGDEKLRMAAGNRIAEMEAKANRR